MSAQDDKDKVKKEIDRLLEQYEKEKESQDLNVNVKVDTSQIQKELMSWRLLKKRAVSKAKELGLDVSEEEIEDYEDYLELARKAREKMEEIEIENLKQDLDVEGVKSSVPSGSVPLSSQQTGKTPEFESYRDMYKFLYKQAHSQDKETRQEAQAILDKMFEKWARGMKNPAYRGFELEDKEFSIEKWREELNKEARAKRGVKTEEGED